MKNYKKLILNALLDGYESSVVFREQNKREQRIYFRFSARTLPEYFDETSVLYDEIHLDMEELERRGFIQIHWKNKKAGHIIDKVSLRLDAIDGAYAFAARKRLDAKQTALAAYLVAYLAAHPAAYPEGCGPEDDGFRDQGRPGDEMLSRFFAWISERMAEGLPIKSYVDLDNLAELDDVVRGVSAVLGNGEECFIRELSMRVYGDSKKLERLQHKIANIIEGFSPQREWLRYEQDVFLACNVVKNPSVLMLKGNVELRLGSGRIRLGELCYGIGVNSKDIGRLELCGQGESEISTILTVENLTTFYSVQREGALIIYLGGFHNEARRNLIGKAHGAFPQAELRHWGDIDAGGFKIYLDLCRKTKLPFSPLGMAAATLEQYRDFTRPLTAGDRKELARLLESLADQPIPERVKQEIAEAAGCMLKLGCKLEQEIVALQ